MFAHHRFATSGALKSAPPYVANSDRGRGVTQMAANGPPSLAQQ